MLMVANITWGRDFELHPVASREEVVRLKKALMNGSGSKMDRDFVFHEGNLLCPVTLDRTHRQLSDIVYHHQHLPLDSAIDWKNVQWSLILQLHIIGISLFDLFIMFNEYRSKVAPSFH